MLKNKSNMSSKILDYFQQNIALKFEFIKETLNLIREERTRVENEIKDLRETEIFPEILHGWIFKVRHILYNDRWESRLSSVTNTASSRNFVIICGAKPSEMNNISKLLNRPSNEETLKMALEMSTLHARIRFMEYILHLSYNLSFKSRRTSETIRSIKEETKKRI